MGFTLHGVPMGAVNGPHPSRGPQGPNRYKQVNLNNDKNKLTWKLTGEYQQMASRNPQTPCLFALAIRASPKGLHVCKCTGASTVLNAALVLSITIFLIQQQIYGAP